MIQGFWHICMLNKYIEIVEEQLKLMVDSGLYDEVKKIHCGCVGDKKNLDDVFQVLKGRKKFIIYHNPDVKVYEFFSLRIIEYMVTKAKFYGFYIHTKACSWPNHPGGKYWRDYMNYYNITQWRTALDHIKLGYDTCGVKFLNYRVKAFYRPHYSGNFFWFNSEYAKTLKPVDTMNIKDRFDAEMWMCSNTPIAATLCQKFVDYNTKGIFKP